MSRPLRLLLLASIVLFPAGWRGASDGCALAAVPRPLEGPLSAAEERLVADGADGRWDDHSLLTAALVAGGVEEPERIREYDERLDHWVSELARSVRSDQGPRQRARAVLEFMHRRILRGGYQLEYADLTLALDQGRYNCATATVLFNCLAERLGLSVCALETPAHVMSRVRLPDEDLDIETTSPDGIRPHRTGREATDVELVAMIYYNRGVDLLGEKQFAEALAANAKALRLAPSNTAARGNLLAALNNWAVAEAAEGRYAAAADLLGQGIRLDPTCAALRANLREVERQGQLSVVRGP